MIHQENPQSIAKQIAEVNDAIPGLDRRVNRVSPEARRKLIRAGKVAVGVGLTGAVLTLGGMDARDEQRQSTPAVSFTEAPRQVTPDQITDEAPATTIVPVEAGEGSYQVTERMVSEGVVAPEHAAATQHNIQVQYDQAGGKHPGETVSVQVGGNR